MIGMWQILIILAILLIFFGPARLEKIGPSLGKAIRGFKKGLDGGEQEEDPSDSAKEVKEVSENGSKDSKDPESKS